MEPRHCAGWWWSHNDVGCVNLQWVEFTKTRHWPVTATVQCFVSICAYFWTSCTVATTVYYIPQIGQNWFEDHSSDVRWTVWPPCSPGMIEAFIGRDIYSHAWFCIYKYRGFINSFWNCMARHISKCIPTTCEINATFRRLLSDYRIEDLHDTKYLFHYFWHIRVNCMSYMIFYKALPTTKRSLSVTSIVLVGNYTMLVC